MKLTIAVFIFLILSTFIFLLVGTRAEATQGHHGPYPTKTPTPTSTPTPSIDPCDVEEKFTEAYFYEFEPCVTPTPEVKQETPPSPFSDGRHSEAPPMPKTGDKVCRAELPAPAYGLTGRRVDSDTVVLSWTPSPVAHDKQVLLYGRSADNLEYGIAELPSDSREVEVNSVWNSHVWFQIGTWNVDCISWSLVGDP